MMSYLTEKMITKKDPMMTDKNSKDLTVPDYQPLIAALIQAPNFENVTALLHAEIAELSEVHHQALYEFLSQDPQAIAAIKRFQNHEDFQKVLWTIVYEEPSDLTTLESAAPCALHFSDGHQNLNHTSLVVVDQSHYPVPQTPQCYPVVQNVRHYPVVRMK